MKDACRPSRRPQVRRVMVGGMHRLTDWLLGLQGLPVYALVGLLVFAEDALFVGFVLPGETAAVLGGVAASLVHASLAVMLVVVIGAAILGDTVGYEVGRLLGPRLQASRLASRRAARPPAAPQQAAGRSVSRPPASSSRSAAVRRCSSVASSRSSGPRCPRWPACRAYATRSSSASTPRAASPGAPPPYSSATWPATPTPGSRRLSAAPRPWSCSRWSSSRSLPGASVGTGRSPDDTGALSAERGTVVIGSFVDRGSARG